MAVDQKALVAALSRFARILPTDYDVASALDELAGAVTQILGLAGAGVTVESEGRLRFVTAHSEHIAAVEKHQELAQEGPCVHSHSTGEVVAVADLRERLERWPEYAAAALQHGVAAVAGVPMRLNGISVGTIDLYSSEVRDWASEDLEVAQVFADMATGYVVNADKRRQTQQLTEQLQQALASRVVIEQAKGIIANAAGITPDEAFERIRRYARDHQARLYAVVHAIVDAGLRL
ncbi:GAF and ANTAR domain-containing protein [Nocardia otitidiscaviarum]|uniref:GAF and ANTAR domain-containing protein n=1 Tax=Nocardia otitidiscaviarum TaxID=1823 RepID=UPI0018944C3F|nr:GAF and ANTAR domain-containing protein [Nocardia otitidiscaviarum]MBF6241033.1 GAF and ANTAR domain-containing protein [Nocardia otitidiscaviarum]